MPFRLPLELSNHLIHIPQVLPPSVEPLVSILCPALWRTRSCSSFFSSSPCLPAASAAAAPVPAATSSRGPRQEKLHLTVTLERLWKRSVQTQRCERWTMFVAQLIHLTTSQSPTKIPTPNIEILEIEVNPINFIQFTVLQETVF